MTDRELPTPDLAMPTPAARAQELRTQIAMLRGELAAHEAALQKLDPQEVEAPSVLSFIIIGQHRNGAPPRIVAVFLDQERAEQHRRRAQWRVARLQQLCSIVSRMAATPDAFPRRFPGGDVSAFPGSTYLAASSFEPSEESNPYDPVGDEWIGDHDVCYQLHSYRVF